MYIKHDNHKILSSYPVGLYLKIQYIIRVTVFPFNNGNLWRTSYKYKWKKGHRENILIIHW